MEGSSSSREGRYHGRSKTRPGQAFREIALYGVCGGILIVLLRLAEYRFLVLRHSVEIYGAIVAATFAALGIWLGGTITRKEIAAVILRRK